MRSEPLLAAVAEVFGTLSVLVTMIWIPATSMPSVRLATASIFECRPAHLGAAVIELDTAIGMDVHERAGFGCTRSC
ncbi:MAG: hypothetical protein R3F08_14930 [Dokdonella sp.]